ncbi:MAG: DbpA RNA binding domain-containing protein [Gemmatimonadota bacterium]
MTDLKVELKDICARLGFTQIPDILETLATPVLRRHHVGLLAGEGSGKGALIGLAAVENCDPGGEGIQVLVLVADVVRGRRLAAAVQRVAGPEGAAVSYSPSPGEGGSPVASETDVLVGRPSDVLPTVRSGDLSLATLRLLVIDGVADMRNLGEWESVEPILETLPQGSRKIAVSDRPDPEFTELLERQLPRARRWPEELLPVASDPDPGEPRESRGTVLCGLVPRAGFADALQRCVSHAERTGCSRLDILCPSESRAARIAADLAIVGRKAELDGSTLRLDLPGQRDAAVLQVGVPLRLDAFAPAFVGDGPRYAITEPRLGPQLDLMLQRSGRRMGVLPGAALAREVDAIQRYRLWLHEEAIRGDFLSELLVLEPLFDEIGSVRLAAVLSRILRGRSELPGMVRPWAEVEEASTGGGGPGAGARDRRPLGTRSAWTRLYFGVGRRDEAKPGDLVGAITGEAGIAGAQIGKVEIMGNFSLVDIDSQVADDVISRLDGATIRGRSVPVRRDRNT